MNRRLALITGGTSGIGAATAQRLAAQGYELLLTGRDRDKGERFVESLPGTGHRFLSFDVSSEWETESAVRDAVGSRALDVLFLNAGRVSSNRTTTDPVELLDSDNFAQLVGVNLTGVVAGLRSALPALYRAERPRVIVTSSVQGLAPTDLDPIYATVKSAVVAFVRAMALRLEPHGVRITAVCPGGTVSGMVPEESIERRANGDIIFRRTGQLIQSSEDVADVVLTIIETDTSGDAWLVDANQPVRRFEFPTLTSHIADG